MEDLPTSDIGIVMGENVIAWSLVGIFFFFQAEDGIRDLTVTGVQTCALPISRELQRDHEDTARRDREIDRRPGLPWEHRSATATPRLRLTRTTPTQNGVATADRKSVV